jgi:hypothetical protein
VSTELVFSIIDSYDMCVSNLEFADTSTCKTDMHNGMMVALVLKAPPPNA